MKKLLIVVAITTALSAQQPPKNLKVLTGVQPGQIIPIMAFIANSLGVTCTHCHVDRKWELDDKPAKEVARRHLVMTRAINESHFGGQQVVTCNMCHGGRVTPAAIPLVANAGWNRQAPPPAQPLPSLDAVLSNYLRAIGGEETWRGMSNRAMRGLVTRMSGREEPKSDTFAAYVEIPSTTEVKTALSYPPEANRELSRSFLASQPRRGYESMRVIGRESVRGHSAVVVEAVPASGRPERLFFDESSALLLRKSRQLQTAVGILPEEYDYDDYRTVDGVVVPFFMQWSRADYRVTHKIDDVQFNVRK